MLARIGRLGNIKEEICKLRDERASGRIDTDVEGISVGFGGSQPAIFIDTGFEVGHAVANLALEYDELDASSIYSFGSDLNSLEIKINYPPAGEDGFYIEYFQKDPSAESRLVSNWLALGKVDSICCN